MKYQKGQVIYFKPKRIEVGASVPIQYESHILNGDFGNIGYIVDTLENDYYYCNIYNKGVSKLQKFGIFINREEDIIGIVPDGTYSCIYAVNKKTKCKIKDGIVTELLVDNKWETGRIINYVDAVYKEPNFVNKGIVLEETIFLDSN